MARRGAPSAWASLACLAVLALAPGALAGLIIENDGSDLCNSNLRDCTSRCAAPQSFLFLCNSGGTFNKPSSDCKCTTPPPAGVVTDGSAIFQMVQWPGPEACQGSTWLYDCAQYMTLNGLMNSLNGAAQDQASAQAAVSAAQAAAQAQAAAMAAASAQLAAADAAGGGAGAGAGAAMPGAAPAGVPGLGGVPGLAADPTAGAGGSMAAAGPMPAGDATGAGAFGGAGAGAGYGGAGAGAGYGGAGAGAGFGGPAAGAGFGGPAAGAGFGGAGAGMGLGGAGTAGTGAGMMAAGAGMGAPSAALMGNGMTGVAGRHLLQPLPPGAVNAACSKPIQGVVTGAGTALMVIPNFKGVATMQTRGNDTMFVQLGGQGSNCVGAYKLLTGQIMDLGRSQPAQATAAAKSGAGARAAGAGGAAVAALLGAALAALLRRRLKRNAPKVRVGVVKRKKTTKAQVPLEVTEQCPAVPARLQAAVEWREQATLSKNYAANRFLLDPNEGFGRNKRDAPLKSKAEREAEDGGTYSDDDELRVLTNQERKSGKAPPKRLTSHQRQIVERLVAAHGDDVQAMFRDRKLNPMQHSVGKLRELLEAHAARTARGSGSIPSAAFSPRSAGRAARPPSRARDSTGGVIAAAAMTALAACSRPCALRAPVPRPGGRATLRVVAFKGAPGSRGRAANAKAAPAGGRRGGKQRTVQLPEAPRTERERDGSIVAFVAVASIFLSGVLFVLPALLGGAPATTKPLQAGVNKAFGIKDRGGQSVENRGYAPGPGPAAAPGSPATRISCMSAAVASTRAVNSGLCCAGAGAELMASVQATRRSWSAAAAGPASRPGTLPGAGQGTPGGALAVVPGRFAGVDTSVEGCAQQMLAAASPTASKAQREAAETMLKGVDASYASRARYWLFVECGVWPDGAQAGKPARAVAVLDSAPDDGKPFSLSRAVRVLELDRVMGLPTGLEYASASEFEHATSKARNKNPYKQSLHICSNNRNHGPLKPLILELLGPGAFAKRSSPFTAPLAVQPAPAAPLAAPAAPVAQPAGAPQAPEAASGGRSRRRRAMRGAGGEAAGGP
ncbi:hypothetical protein HT031_002972 [Scenedesmus sp. PABB004]|nr:hypothetical protein HT031_002972 [Scenedesmus sp. PABB004]